MYSSLIRKSLALTFVISATAGSALATTTRVIAHSGNVGIEDDTDFMTFASETGEAGNNAWLNNIGGISGAVSWDGTAVAVSASADSFSAAYFSDDGDTGYSAGISTSSTDDITVGGSYSTSDGGDNMAFGGSLAMVGDTMGVSAGAVSRSLTDDEVTAWGAGVDYNDGSIALGGNYDMGVRFGTDTSNAALTYGAGLSVDMPDGGDMAASLSIGNLNLAGEFMFNDWVGIRGSVTSGLSYDVTGDGGLSGGGGSMFGATFHSDGADIDLLVSPDQLTGGPYFLTGNAMGSVAVMSARFDI